MTDPSTAYTVHLRTGGTHRTTDAQEAEIYSRKGHRVTAVMGVDQ